VSAWVASVRARCSTLWSAEPGVDAVVLRVIVALVVPFGWIVLLLSVPPVQRLIRRLRPWR
jgi:hypothetical protein